MRVVCISDTHTLHNFTVPDGDMIVHAGDCMDSGRNVEEFRRFMYWFKNLPHRHKVFIAGNHDWALDPGYNISKRLQVMEMVRDSNVVYLQDEEREVGGLRVYGAPWQPEFCGWAFNLPRGGEQLARRWAAIPEGLDILITHGPPKGILDLNVYDRQRCGCELLRDRVAIVKPKLHVFGHIHGSYGQEQVGDTLFVNAAVCNERYNPVNPPQVIELP